LAYFADFANFCGKGQNIHLDLFGALHGFGNKTRYTPFIFTGIGRIRDSNAGTITNSFAWFAGGGLTIRLTRCVSFQTIPIEYVMNTERKRWQQLCCESWVCACDSEVEVTEATISGCGMAGYSAIPFLFIRGAKPMVDADHTATPKNAHMSMVYAGIRYILP
jgi:hypothetical protein